MKEFRIYTDGSVAWGTIQKGQKARGPGAWGFVAYPLRQPKVERYGYMPGEQTNNRAELQAIIEALDWLFREYPEYQWDAGPVLILSDSKYLVNGCMQWVWGWKANGWYTADKKPVKNQDQWETIHGLLGPVTQRKHWIQIQHIPRERNEEADAVSRMAYEGDF